MSGRQVIPPPKLARLQKKTQISKLKERDEAINRIKELGKEDRKRWKEEVGYHRRSRIESCMSRYKRILGDRLSAQLENKAQNNPENSTKPHFADTLWDSAKEWNSTLLKNSPSCTTFSFIWSADVFLDILFCNVDNFSKCNTNF